MSTFDDRWDGKSWEWFELSYTSWLTIPRIVLQSMPVEWQEKFFSLLDEIEETIEVPAEAEMETTVSIKKDGRFVRSNLLPYRHNLCPFKKDYQLPKEK